MVDAVALTVAIQGACPAVSGVSIGSPADRSTWRTDYDPGQAAPTDTQRQAVAGIIAGWVDPMPVPVASRYQIALALNAQGSAPSAAFDAALVKAKSADRNRWGARTDALPADNPVFVRLCGIAGVDPVALHALAVTQ